MEWVKWPWGLATSANLVEVNDLARNLVIYRTAQSYLEGYKVKRHSAFVFSHDLNGFASDQHIW